MKNKLIVAVFLFIMATTTFIFGVFSLSAVNTVEPQGSISYVAYKARKYSNSIYTYYTSIQAAIETASDGDVIEVIRSHTISAPITVSKKISLMASDGLTVSLTRGSSFYGNMLQVLAGGELNIGSSAQNYTGLLTFDGENRQLGQYGQPLIQTSNVLKMYNGIQLVNNFASNKALAVNVASGSFYLYGGLIQNNKSNDFENNGVIYLNNGTFGYFNGGSIYVPNNTIKQYAIYSENARVDVTATNVYAQTGYNAIMMDGTLSSTRANLSIRLDAYVEGVDLIKTYLNLSDGEIANSVTIENNASFDVFSGGGDFDIITSENGSLTASNVHLLGGTVGNIYLNSNNTLQVEGDPTVEGVYLATGKRISVVDNITSLTPLPIIPSDYTIGRVVALFSVGLTAGRDYFTLVDAETYSSELIVVGQEIRISTTEDFEIIVSPTSYVYDGQEKTPSVTVKMLNVTLTKDVDYVLTGDTSKTDVGDYVIDVTGLLNYINKDQSAYWSITPNPTSLSVTLTQSSFVYTGSTITPYISQVKAGSTTVLTSSDYEIVTVSSTLSATNIGDYIITVRGIGNYSGTGTAEWHITPLSLTSVTFASVTYNGLAQTPVATVLPSGATYALSPSNYTQTNAGTYTVSIVGTGNYSGTVSNSWIINTKGLTGTWGATNSWTYDGSAHGPSFTGWTGVVGTDSAFVSYSLTDETAVNVGNYTAYAVITGTKKDNYHIAGGGSKTYSITAQALTAVSFTATTYDATTQSPVVASITPSGALTSSSYEFVGTYQYKNAGTYTITIRGTGNHQGEVQGSWTINKANTIVVSWTNTSLIYTGSLQGPTASIVSGVISGDSVGVSVSGQQSAVGSYTATATLSGTHKDNYTILSGGTTSFTIGTKALTLSWGSLSLVYNGSAQKPTVSILTGVIGSEVVTVSVSDTYLKTDVGGPYSAVATLGGTNAGNYHISGDTTKSFYISQKGITINWTPSGTAEFVYNGTAQGPVPSLSGIETNDIGEEKVDLLITNGTAIDVGSYTASVSLTGTRAFNYSISNGDSKPYSITPADLEGIIEFEDATYTYNATTKTLSPTGMPAGVTVSYVTTVTEYNADGSDLTKPNSTLNSFKEAGVYYITASFDGGDNYDDLVLYATLTISRASISIKADNKTSVYGESIASPLTWSVSSGQIFSGDNTSFEGIFNISTLATSSSNVGTYTISISTSGHKNYNISTTIGTYTITKATLTGITFSNDTVTYDSQAHYIEPLASSLPSGVSVSSYSTSAKEYKAQVADAYDTASTVASNTFTNAGQYVVTAYISGGTNYENTTKQATLQINRKAVTYYAVDKSSVYGETPVALTYLLDASSTVYAGDVSSVQATLSLSCSVTSASAVGEYTITLQTTGHKNYNITVQAGTYEITKATITGITFVDKTETYNNTQKTITITGTPPTGTSVSYLTTSAQEYNASGTLVTVTAGTNAYTQAGVYAVSASVTGSNYNTLTLTATLTISRRSVTYTADDKNTPYGATVATLTYALTSGTIITGQESSVTGTLSIVTSPTVTTSSSVGNYTIVLSTSGHKNYDITTVNGTYTVGKQNITGVTFANKTETYNGSAFSIVATNLPSGTSIRATNPYITQAKENNADGSAPAVATEVKSNSFTNAGTYVITVYISGGTNYNDASFNATLTINRATPTLAFGQSSVTVTAGNSVTNVATPTPVTGGVVSYVSLDTGVATVNSSGVATAKLNPTSSSTTITATLAGTKNYTSQTANYTLTIQEAVAQVGTTYYTSISSAVQNASAGATVIVIKSHTISSSTIAIAQNLTILSNADITVTSANTIISALFKVTTGTVTFGGGTGMLTFNGVNAVNGNGLINIETAGKVIVAATNLTVTNFYGGVFNLNANITTGGGLTINGGTFSQNRNSNGGVISRSGGSLSITGGTFSGNQSSNYGGVIYNSLTTASFDITGASFTNNTSVLAGGVIYTTGASTYDVVIEGSTFSGNSSTTSSGGVIYSALSSAVIDVTIEDSDFLSNTANGSAAAIYISNTIVTNSSMVIVSSNFEKNSVSLSTEGTITGGVIYTNFVDLTIDGDDFLDNTTASNTNGVAIYAANANFNSLSASTFNGSLSTKGSADVYGGAIYLVNTTIDIDDVYFYNNEATVNGGAIYMSNTTGTIGNVYSGGNQAYNGGVFYITTSSSITLQYGNEYYSNTSLNDGSVIYSYNSSVIILAGLFEENTAIRYATLYAEGGNLSLTTSAEEEINFSDNSSLDDFDIYTTALQNSIINMKGNVNIAGYLYINTSTNFVNVTGEMTNTTIVRVGLNSGHYTIGRKVADFGELDVQMFKFILTGNENYELITIDKTLVVGSAQPLQFNVTGTLYYNGSSQQPTYTVTVGGVELVKDATNGYEIINEGEQQSVVSATNAGTYTIYIKGKGNYINKSGSFQWTILAQPVVITLNAGAGSSGATTGSWVWASNAYTQTLSSTGTSTLGSLPSPTKTGYVFGGWETVGAVAIDASTLVPTTDTTYIAKWDLAVAQNQNTGIYYTSIASAVSAATADDTILVIASHTITSAVTINKDLTITANSNYTVTRGALFTSTVFTISSGYTLTFGGGTGIVTINGNNVNSSDGGVFNNSGTLTIYKGTFKNNKSNFGGVIYNTAEVILNGGDFLNNVANFFNMYSGVLLNHGGTVTINDGSFSGNDGVVYNNNGTVTIKDGIYTNNTNVINNKGTSSSEKGILIIEDGIFGGSGENEGNTAVQGGVIFNNEYGEVTISNAHFEGNSTINGSVSTGNQNSGGVIYNSGGTVTINSGTFINNTASYGGVIYNNGGAVTIYDGEFTSNTATTNGGVVNINNTGTLTIYDGEFTSNSATYDGGVVNNNNGGTVTISGGIFGGTEVGEANTATYGGVINNINDSGEGYSILNISDCSFVNNSATTSGGAIYNQSTLNISGSPEFSGNTENSVSSDIYLSTGKKVNVPSTLTVLSPIILTSAVTTTGTTVVTFTALPASPLALFAMSSAHALYVSGNDLKISETPVAQNERTSIKYTSISDAVTYATTGDTILIIASHTITSAITIDKNLTITANSNYTVTRGSDATFNTQSMFAISSGFTLTFGGGTGHTGIITIDGDNISGVTGGGVFNNSGTLTIYKGTFKNNKSDVGGVIYNTAEVILNGGSFLNNVANFFYMYSGVLFNHGGTVTINDGSFSGNDGVVYNNNGTVTIKDGIYTNNTNVINNKGTSSSEKGILIIEDGIFGGSGENEGNTANQGGIIYNGAYGEVTISNAFFIGNATVSGDVSSGFENSGGVIYNAGASSTVTITSGTFTNNSSVNGGVIYNNGGAVTIYDGEFTSNTATTNGGVVNINNGGAVTIYDGEFTSNSATYGGVVNNNNGGTVTISGGIFGGTVTGEANTAVYGGVIYNNNGAEITIYSGTFTGNSSIDHGGVIYNIGTVTINSGTFNSNTSGYNGGVIYNAATLTINNGTFKSNFATDSGGVIENTATGSVTITGGLFGGTGAGEGNVADASLGGAINNIEGGVLSLVAGSGKTIRFYNNSADEVGKDIYSSADYSIGGNIENDGHFTGGEITIYVTATLTNTNPIILLCSPSSTPVVTFNTSFQSGKFVNSNSEYMLYRMDNSIYCVEAMSSFTVKHYYQNTDGTYPTEVADESDINVFYLTTGAEITDSTIALYDDPAGEEQAIMRIHPLKYVFSYMTPTSATVTPDNATIVKMYYDREIYSLTLGTEPEGAFTSVSLDSDGIIDQDGNVYEIRYGSYIELNYVIANEDAYSFDRWSADTYVSGGINDDPPSSSMNMPKVNVVVKALATPNTYTLTFNANGGLAGETSRQRYYDEEFGKLPNAEKIGSTFLGWFNQALTIPYESGSQMPDHDLTIYAKWQVNNYTLTFNPDGGSVTPTSMQVTYGQILSNLPTPTKSGYTFGGWFGLGVGWDGSSAATSFAGGAGTQASPYQINNASQLKYLANLVNTAGTTETYSTKYYILTAHIDLGACQNWIPIGTSYQTKFQGSFDGNGYQIHNLNITTPSTGYVGLFGYTLNAILNNVILSNVDIDINYSAATLHVGSIVGYAQTPTITNSQVIGANSSINVSTSRTANVGGLIGDVPSASTNYAYYNLINNASITVVQTGTGVNTFVGGIAGAYTFVENVVNNGLINVTSASTAGNATCVGGIVGREGFTAFALNTNAITVYASTAHVGGIIGYSTTAKEDIMYAINEGDIYLETNNESTAFTIGGVVGMAQSVSFYNVFNFGSVELKTNHAPSADSRIGGVVGYANLTVQKNSANVFNNATITVTIGGVSGIRNVNIGGVFGEFGNANGQDSIIENVSNTASINISTAGAKVNVGGVFGKLFCSAYNVYNIGNITATSLQTYIGGIVGLSNNAVAKIYFAFNTGNLTATSTDAAAYTDVGGISGYKGTILYSYNIGSVTAIGAVEKTFADAIVNVGTSGSCTSCYYNNTVTVVEGGVENEDWENANGTYNGSLNIAYFKTPSTFTQTYFTWDASIWNFVSGYYPSVKSSVYVYPDVVEETIATFTSYTSDIEYENGTVFNHAGNLTVTAAWTPTNYTISYVLNGGSWASGYTAPANYNIESENIPLPTLANITAPNSVFAGWYNNAGFTGSVVTSIQTGSTGNKTFYAKWNTAVAKNDTTGIYYTTLEAAVSAVTADNNVILIISNATVSSQMTINYNNMTIKSNTAYTITRNAGFQASMFVINSGKTLTFGGGTAALKVDGAGVAVTTAGGVFRNFGTLNIQTNSTFTRNYISLGSTYESIENIGGSVVFNVGTLNITGGTFGGSEANANYSSANGGLIYNYLGIINISGSPLFSYNYAVESYGSGGVIYSNGNNISASVTISGGTFEYNHGTHGGLLFNYNMSTTTISGGTFSNNYSNLNAGLINNNNSILNISGGTFSSNTNGTNGQGIIRNGTNATLNISSGSFTNNSSTSYGGVVYNDTSSNLDISGNPTFSGNTQTNGTVTSDIYLATGKKVYVSASLSSTGIKLTPASFTIATVMVTYSTELTPSLTNFTLVGNSGYKLVNPPTTYDLVIGSTADMSLALSGTPYSYDATAKTPTPTVTVGGVALVKDATNGYVILSETGKVSVTSATNAGTYTIYIRGTGAYSDKETSQTWTINQRAITVTAANKSKVYGAALPAFTYTITSGSLVSGHSATVAMTTTADASSSVGTYPITIGTVSISSGTDVTANYTVTKVNGTLTITPKIVSNLTVTLSSTSTVYNGLQQSVSVSSVQDGVTLLYPTTDYTVKSGTTGTTAGTYTVIVEGKGNYAGSSGEETWTITAKEVTITWSGGTTFTYNGSAQGPDYTQSGIVAGDLTTYVTHSATAKQINVGSYTRTVTLSGTRASSYSLTNASQNYSISKADTNITMSPTSLTVYVGQTNNTSLTATLIRGTTAISGASLTNSGITSTYATITSSSTNTSGISAFTIVGKAAKTATTVTVSYAGDSNHNATSATFSLTITQLILTINAVSQGGTTAVSKTSTPGTYSATSQNINVSYNGTIYIFASAGTGYAFGSWTKNSGTGTVTNTGTANTTVTGITTNVTMSVSFTASTYTVAYNGNKPAAASATVSGTTANSSHTYDVAKNLTTNGYSLTGWTFAGWNSLANGTGANYTNGQSVTNLSSTNGATVTLYAKWTQNTYAVAFNANTGSGTMSNQSFNYEESKALTSNAFTKPGHSFANWNTASDGSGTSYSNGQTVSKLAISGTFTLYARWSANTYTITYDENGGSALVDKTYSTPDATYTLLTTSTKTGYIFGGWKVTSVTASTVYKSSGTFAAVGDTITQVYTGSFGNITVQAQWTAKTYTITLNQNTATTNGSTSATATYNSSTLTAITNPLKTGYIFAGWTITQDGTNTLITTSGTLIASVSGYTDSSSKWVRDNTVTLYAKWTAKTYTITLNQNGATTNGSTSATATYDLATLTAITNPLKTGYTFAGWTITQNGTDTLITTSGTLTASVSGYTNSSSKWIRDGVATVYAKWTPTNYTITYNLNGGSWTSGYTAPANYNIESSNIPLPTIANVVKTNNVFAGWYNNASFTGDVVTSIPAGSTGNQAFYAKWNTAVAQNDSTGIYYTSIASAVSAASANNIILIIASHTITSAVTINKNLTIKSPTGVDVTVTRAESFTGTMFTISAFCTLTFGGGTGVITIDGDNISVTANGAVFNISESFASLTINNGIFKNNNLTGNGGVIYSSRNITINDGTFISNTATGHGGVIYSSGSITINDGIFISNTATGHGGVIYGNSSDSITINDGTFTSNSAGTPSVGSSGGVLYSYYSLVIISGGTFTSNSAGSAGGVIYAQGNSGSIVDAYFEGNEASSDGGAFGGVLYTYNSNFEIENSSFIENYASDHGGVIYNVGILEITSGTFTGNHASSGGVIYNKTMDETSYVRIFGGQFGGTVTGEANTAAYGGVIYNYSGVLNISNGLFTNNSAYAGGVIFNAENGSVNILAGGTILFVENSAIDHAGEEGTVPGEGGVIFNFGYVEIEYAIFKGNSASHGGVFLNRCDNNTPTINIFDGQFGGTVTGEANTAILGGIIYNDSGILNISGGSFINNIATTSGGAIYNEDTFNISGSPEFSGNTENSVSSDIYLSTGKKVLVPSTLTVSNPIKITSQNPTNGTTVVVTFTTLPANPLALFAMSSAHALYVSGNDLKIGAPVAQNERTSIKYTSISDAVTYSTTGDTILIIATHTITSANAITIDKNLTIKANTAVTITRAGYDDYDLFNIESGKTLTFGTLDSAIITLDGNSFENNEFPAFYNQGTLIINKGNFINHNVYNDTSGAVIYNKGTLTINGGTFTGNSADFGSVIANKSGTVNIADGIFKGNFARHDGGVIYNSGLSTDTGTVNITGGSFGGTGTGEANTAPDGGVIYNGQYGEVNISNAQFIGNKALDESYNGYGGVIYNAGTSVTITSGTFNSNTSIDVGGVIYNTTILTINNGTFKSNGAVTDGGVVCNTSTGSVTITGGTFGGTVEGEGNRATESFGGAIDNWSGGTLSLVAGSGKTIRFYNNSAGEVGDDIYSSVGFNIGGDVENNGEIYYSGSLTVSSTLTNTNAIKIFGPTDGTPAVIFTTYQADKFVSYNPDYTLYRQGNNLYMGPVNAAARIGGTYYSSFYDANTAAVNGDTIFILSNFTATSQISVTKTITIAPDGADRIITRGASYLGTIFNITATVTIGDATNAHKLTITGNNVSGVTGRLISASTLTLKGKIDLINNKYGAIEQGTSGTLSFAGQTINITGNSGVANGSGLSTSTAGSVNFDSGTTTFASNYSVTSGSAIYTHLTRGASQGSIKFNGGTTRIESSNNLIAFNTVHKIYIYSGATVYALSNNGINLTAVASDLKTKGSITMTGGTVDGIFTNSVNSSISISGGTISGDYYGIYNNTTGTVNISGSASVYGGQFGIYNNSTGIIKLQGSPTITGGRFGIYLNEVATSSTDAYIKINGNLALTTHLTVQHTASTYVVNRYSGGTNQTSIYIVRKELSTYTVTHTSTATFRVYDDKTGGLVSNYGWVYGMDWSSSYNRFETNHDGVAYEYWSGQNFIVYSSMNTCFSSDTYITVWDEKRKKLRRKKAKDIKYTDKILVWNFDKGCYDFANPLTIQREDKAFTYYEIYFSDGSVLEIVNDHAIFNVDKNMFTPMVSDDSNYGSPVGTRVMNDKGEIVTIISKKKVDKQISYTNIFTKFHLNLYANGILTSTAFNNMYPIKDMKFIPDDRQCHMKSLLDGINDEWRQGMRLDIIPDNIILAGLRHFPDCKTFADYVNKKILMEKPKE